MRNRSKMFPSSPKILSDSDSIESLCMQYCLTSRVLTAQAFGSTQHPTMQNLDTVDEDFGGMIDRQRYSTLRKFFGLWFMMADDEHTVRVIFTVWKMQSHPLVGSAVTMNPGTSTDAERSSFWETLESDSPGELKVLILF